MISLAQQAERTPADIANIAATLCGAGVSSVSAVRGGGNNRVYRVSTGDGDFALKVYPSRVDDPRDRLGTEFGALTFLFDNGITTVPRPVGRDDSAGIGLYEWIDGQTVIDPQSADIDAAADFARRLRGLSRHPDAAELSPASESCPAASELVRQIESRFQRLRAIEGNDALAVFLENALLPFAQASIDQARNAYARDSRDFDADLAHDALTLSPSDFGFHNALRRDDGSVAFIDFEYFGWDDPVRLAVDFLLHPGMTLDSSMRLRFTGHALEIFGEDATFRRRLELLFPLVGVRWCAILLNEFFPECWARRAYAGVTENRETVQLQQLEKSRCLLARLQAPKESFNDPV